MEQLVFVSDSRLSGDGRNFDGCPKILRLPRNDCAIAFAGYTGHAFPLMLQLSLAIDSYGPARHRAMEISKLQKHLLKVFDSMAALIVSSPKLSKPEDIQPEANFLFGGYSSVKKQFEIWAVEYKPTEQHFRGHPAQWAHYSENAKKVLFAKTKGRRGVGSSIAFAGNMASELRKRLSAKLAAKYGTGTTYRGLDWEPFEVVRDMLREPNHSETIGGAPQIVRVYQHIQTVPLAVYWPDRKAGKIYLQGRPCLGTRTSTGGFSTRTRLSRESPAHSPKHEMK